MRHNRYFHFIRYGGYPRNRRKSDLQAIIIRRNRGVILAITMISAVFLIMYMVSLLPIVIW